jgi:hypothetical protein
MENNLKLILVAPDKSLYAAFQEYFDYFPNVEVSNNYFEWLKEYDCLVSPANSFGMMDGGMDAAIAKFYLPMTKDIIQKYVEVLLWKIPHLSQNSH